MCLFTHFAAGALAGGATGHVGWAIPAGAASHALLDAIPHYDHPDWRVELAGGMAALVLLLLMPFASPAAVVGGLFGMAPDLENLFQKLGRLDRKRFIFPSHTGLIPHGRNLGPRSLVWQFVIFAVCFGALGLVNPSTAAAAQDEGAVMGRPQVQVLTADRDRTLLRIDFPVTVQPTLWDGLGDRRIEWALAPQYAEDEDGTVRQLPPVLPVTLAVPTTEKPQTRIEAVSWWREPAVAVEQEQLADFARPAVYRSVPLSGATIPLAVGGGVLRSLTVSVQHPAQAEWNRDADLARTAADEPSLNWSEAAPTSVVNTRQFEELSAIARGADLVRAQRAVEKAARTDLFGQTSHWVRFDIDETGVYRITGQELLVAGVSSSSVHPASLRLYRGGSLPLDPDPTLPDSLQADRAGLNEVPIEVLGAGDGEWNLDDELRFYGVSTSTWLDRLVDGADPLEHYDHPMADAAVYWLTWESTSVSPLPGTPLRVTEAAGAPTGGAIVQTARLRRHFEEQKFSDAGRVADNFTWFNSVSSSWSSDFDLPGAVTDSTAFFVIDFRGMISTIRLPYNYMYRALAWANDSLADSASTSFSAYGQQDSLRVRLAGRFAPRTGAGNRIVLQNNGVGVLTVEPPIQKQDLATDSYDILYWAGLDLTDHPGQLEMPVWDGQTGTATADLVVTGPAGQAPLLWDVTDPFATRTLTGAVTAAHPAATTFGVELGAEEHGIFQALTADRLLDVGHIERTSPAVLREQAPDVDYLVVYPGAFRTAAVALVDHRSSYLPGVDAPVAAAVDVQDIYDNFSGGQKDWRAIRNYLRFVYEAGGGRLKYVCLLGNACRDYRNQLGRTPQVDQFYDFVPTDVRTGYPKSPSWYYSEWPYASDDSFVSFDVPASGYLDAPDVAVGRLPAISAAEAMEMVSRTIAFDTETPVGAWRNSVTLVADDQKYQGIDPYASEWRHTAMAEDIATLLLPPTIDVERIYSLAYDFPPGGLTKPDVKAAINTTVNRGTTIYHYIGHGSQDSLADERIFDDNDITALTNGERLCMFSAFSCDVGMFDSTFRRSMGESFLASAQGGAIVTITASQVSFVSENNQLTVAFYEDLFPDRSADPAVTPGLALMRAKGRMNTPSNQRNSQRYNLMGDPASRLPHPVSDLEFAADTVDTLLTGRLGTVRTDGAAPGDRYLLRVEEASTSHFFVSATRDTYDYVLRGAPIFQGTGVAAGSDLAVPFMVPTQIRRGEDARVRLVVGDDDLEHAVQMRLPAVRSTSLPGTDLVGPQIDLAFADGLQRVRPGATLNATLSDPAGIATVGTSPITSILLEFDDIGFMSNLTESFTYDADSYTTGRISLALPAEMESGDHSVSLYAADAFGNVGSDTLSFRIEDTIGSGVESMALFPNPTSGPCRLVFELGEPMQLQWDIFTLSGKRVRTMRAGFDTAGPASMGWDGRDDQGDDIANGTYLYVLRGRGESDPDHPVHKTGKLVLMK